RDGARTRRRRPVRDQRIGRERQTRAALRRLSAKIVAHRRPAGGDLSTKRVEPADPPSSFACFMVIQTGETFAAFSACGSTEFGAWYAPSFPCSLLFTPSPIK